MKITGDTKVLFYNETCESFFKNQLANRLKMCFDIKIQDLPSVFIQMGIGSKEYVLDLISCSDEFLKFSVIVASDKEYIIEIRKETSEHDDGYCISITGEGYTVIREYAVVRAIKAFCIHEITS